MTNEVLEGRARQMTNLEVFLFRHQVCKDILISKQLCSILGKSPERSYSPTMRHTAHGILKSQQSLASEILA